MENGAPGGAGSAANGSSNMSRAEKFEDEKRRIIESIFNKKDDDGLVQESYITHIRIVEDAAYPSSPPPPNNNPEGKKPRIIIVAVRKSGRVRVHKARENTNGTFSIGKTWSLDELSSVESFSSSVSRNAQEEQRKQWAGDMGFIVTIGKPYYWQANSSKEKQFFIASLVKIYTKYTGGKSPELIGFDDRERSQILGAGGSQGQPPLVGSGGKSSAQPTLVTSPPYDQTQTRSQRSTPSRETIPRQLPPEQSLSQRSLPSSNLSNFSPSSQNQRGPASTHRDGSPSRSIDSTIAPAQAISSNLRKLAVTNQSQESFSSRDDTSSLPPRSRGGLSGMGNVPGRLPDRSATPTSLRTATPENENREGNDEIPPVPAPLTYPPERRRPPLQGSPEHARSREMSNENLVPAPLSSPGMLRDNSRPSTRGKERPDAPQEDILSKMNRPAEVAVERPSPRTDLGPAAGEKTADSTPGTPADIIQPLETSPIELTAPPVPEERPGLGPMIKKKSRTDIANTFRKAATAANAFKPRAGGAAERMQRQQEKLSGPDGITEVVLAPGLRGLSNDGAQNTLPAQSDTPDQARSETSVSEAKANESIPEVKINVPPPNRPSSIEGALEKVAQADTSSAEKVKLREMKRTKPVSETIQKELATLGLEASLFDGRGDTFAELLDEFGWAGEGIRTRNIDQMKEDIERELNNVQVGGWLRRFEQEEETQKMVADYIDRCLLEVDEFDNLLTLYNVELGTLTEDIAYIEAQGQGLQVQAANQKLLQAELTSLLDTVSISSSQLQPLREAPLETSRGLEQVEASLVMLFKAMVTIDPTVGATAEQAKEIQTNGPVLKTGGVGGSELGNMRILLEKKTTYRSESMMFMRRLHSFIEAKFEVAIEDTKKAIERDRETNLGRRTGKSKLDPKLHEIARLALWRYSPLLLFAREVDRFGWHEMLSMYGSTYKPVYQDEIRDVVFAWKRSAKRPTGDDNETLFTSQTEKQTEGIASTARKLTVKRSQTLAKSLRSPLGDNSSRITVDKVNDGRINPYEAFGNIMDEIIPLVIVEQNFIVDFFHVSSLEIQDFADNVTAAPPDLRRGGDLRKIKPMDPNRELSKTVSESMERVYSFLPLDLQQLVDWTTSGDPLQGVGVLTIIERKLLDVEESSQEYLVRTLQRLHSRLSGQFTKFLDEQIRAIEETKVKIKKRKGVIGFIRTFPTFSAALETKLVSAEDLEVREMVNNAYVRVIKTMFESLKIIAREIPSAATTGTTIGDPEDKEALNYQILLIENMNHYLEEVETKNNPVLEEWKEKAEKELDEHLNLYLGAVIHRPLGKLIDYLESTESLVLSLPPGTPLSTIAARASHSKATFKRLLSTYDSKEIRRGIETLKRRVEKHFGDADDPSLSRGLVSKVLDACERYYENVEARVSAISSDVYDGDVRVEWTTPDVSSSFRR